MISVRGQDDGGIAVCDVVGRVYLQILEFRSDEEGHQAEQSSLIDPDKLA